MKLLCVADLHFNNYKFGATGTGSVNSRCNDIGNALLYLIEKTNPDGLIIAGDVFHTRGRIPVPIFNYVHSVFNQINVPMWFCSGNHDMAAISLGDSALDTFVTIPSVQRVVTHGAEIIELPYNYKVGFIPYIHEILEFKDTFAKVAGENPDMIVCHVGIDNIKPTANIPDFGFNYEFINSLYSNVVVAGHYHIPSIKTGVSTVISPGGIIQHNFGDAGQDRGGVLYDTETKQAEFIPAKFPRFKTITKIDDFTGEEFVKIRSETIEEARKIKRKLLNKTKCITVETVKSKTVEKARPTIKLGTPQDMINAYIDVHEGYYGKYRKKILSVFNEVCIDEN